ncbi:MULTISPECIES: alpha/beta hydrolase-fold protein [unclassified Clostridium]|uniref:alpha/beta hydrolase n=1 Tax=unclassified Clostridium TaxID=2614128 RepID=UPI0013F01CEC|nr:MULTISPECIES: alpha/beta hydrolase-fold protein [unclassified Clostridium]NFG61132.1 alpha/beta hydrolase [Clostridium botulinum]NFQ08878.1 alpha/beta hydrolase [Clostridium botulinum]
MDNFKIKSNYTNSFYDIKFYIPEESNANDLPLIVVLDGGYYFEIVKSCIKQQGQLFVKTGVKPAIVVGICHQEFEKKEKRFLDFTAPAEKYFVDEKRKFMIPDNLGGSEDFNSFIEKELLPIIQANLNFHKNDMTIIGHSLSGYYVLWNLLKGSNIYKNIISFSPSVWWNDYEILNFKNLEHSDKNVFIGLGKKEGYMVDGAEKIYNKIKSFNDNCSLYIAPEENHGSVVITSISRALRYIFSI